MAFTVLYYFSYPEILFFFFNRRRLVPSECVTQEGKSFLSRPVGKNGVSHGGEETGVTALVIFRSDGACVEPPSVCRAALRAGHLIPINSESGSVLHICSLSTPQKPTEKLVPWSLRSGSTREDGSCCWIWSRPSGGQVLTQSLGELRSQASIVLYRYWCCLN